LVTQLYVEERPSAIHVKNKKSNMEPTLTQSGALYLAQHKIAKRRRAFFRRSRAAGGKRIADIVTFGELASLPVVHRDNGR
jgi:hypothetical protein